MPVAAMMLARERERNLPDRVDASWGESKQSGRLLQQNLHEV
jgi:hypothetical protein